MKKKILLAFVLVLLSVSMFVSITKPVEAAGTIYIRADGSIDPPTANITTVDNVTYTFTGNISDSIVVERDNIIVDGARYTLQGPSGYAVGEFYSKGIDLTGRNNVTIANVKIEAFHYGVWLNMSSNNSIARNNMTDNGYGVYSVDSSNNILSENRITSLYVGIWLEDSSNYNIISENNITNNLFGIELYEESNHNKITGNNVTNNSFGVWLYRSSNNTISGNNVEANNYHGVMLKYSSSHNIVFGNTISTNNYYGFELYWASNNNRVYENNITNNGHGAYIVDSSVNRIYHNTFVYNTEQVSSTGSTNTWDDGYPSGGNYWSDYEEKYPNATEIDGSGIWDAPYVIDEYNQDNYPVIPEFPTWTSMLLMLTVLTVALAIYKRGLLKMRSKAS